VTGAKTSVLAWVALGFAVLAAFVAATQVMIVLREAGGPGRFALVGRTEYLLLPLLGILLAAFGWRRRRKRWPAVAITISLLSFLTLVLVSSRTWGPPPAGGESPWHRPDFQWGG
jgi:hypothetical protein